MKYHKIKNDPLLRKNSGFFSQVAFQFIEVYNHLQIGLSLININNGWGFSGGKAGNTAHHIKPK
jgi:hypothetical protein